MFKSNNFALTSERESEEWYDVIDWWTQQWALYFDETHDKYKSWSRKYYMKIWTNATQVFMINIFILFMYYRRYQISII